MTSYFCVVFLLSAVMATAVPLSDLDRVLKAFIQVLNEEEVMRYVPMITDTVLV